MPTPPTGECDVLVVGAGPTGLTLAAALNAAGVTARVIDQNLDAAHESRALAVQPRSLEVLRGFGLADELVARGNPEVRLRIHAGPRVVPARLFDIGLEDTAYPFLLFVSQAVTEAVLGDHLVSAGIQVERGVRLLDFEVRQDNENHGCGGGGVEVTLQLADGTRQRTRTRYLVGCDGAHSVVRDGAGIAFEGGGYPQTFLLADLAVDGLETGAVHAWLTEVGPLFFFPLENPAPWRLITMRSPAAEVTYDAARDARGDSGSVPTSPVSLAELQSVADRASGQTPGVLLRLEEPVWATAFRLQHRHAAAYRVGPVFLAGDAAHVHSPAGAQGMNTGIQDAANLGWKLALVVRGVAPEGLLDTFEAERRPVGAFVLRFTDRAFSAATSTSPVVGLARRHVVPRVIPLALRFRPGRAVAFRTVSQLDVAYRNSPAVEPMTSSAPPRSWRGVLSPVLRRFRGSRPRPGDRLPDARVTLRGEERWLHQSLGPASFHLLLVGSSSDWDELSLGALGKRHGDLLAVHRLEQHASTPEHLGDPSSRATGRLGVTGTAHFVVRPDGHIGYRADHADLTGAQHYLARWLIGTR